MHIFFLLIFSSSLFAKELHQEAKWLRLLHYKKNFYGTYVSEADAKNFFLSEEGKKNPEKELKKTIEVFGSTDKPFDDHPICKFPLRYKWLNSKLGNPWKADLSGCKNYIEFFSKLAARRASIVFSSYYLTNPNSAFGHTLLRLSRFDDKNETEMLDYGINYAAQANESNPFLYAVKGLFGGFRGEFAAIPYYYKIREYSDFEFRDLWSFDLKLTQAEILEMVDHIWELGNTYFDYFYFHENCSYHLLSIIEAARPELKLTERYSAYTIPADTIRLLEQENLIEEGKRRESTYSRLVRKSEKLSMEDLDKAKRIAIKPELASETMDAKLLDVALEAFDYRNFEGMLKDDPKTKEKKFPLLVARAKNPETTSDEVNLSDIKKDSPARSHSPTRFTLAESYTKNMGKGTRIEYRAALHDLLDPPAGSLKQAQLEMAKISIEVQEEDYGKSKLRLDHFSIFNLKNYQEQNFWSSPLSWEVDVGARNLNYQGCFDCPAGFVSGGVGNSSSHFGNRMLLTFLLNSEIAIQDQFTENYRFGLGPKFFARFRFSDHFVMGLTTFYHYQTFEIKNLVQEHEWVNELEARVHLNQRFSVALKGIGIERDRIWTPAGILSLQYFYE